MIFLILFCHNPLLLHLNITKIKLKSQSINNILTQDHLWYILPLCYPVGTKDDH